MNFFLECVHSSGAFACVSVAKLGLYFPEFPSSSELGLAEIVDDKTEVMREPACSEVQVRGQAPAAVHPHCVLGAAVWPTASLGP